MTSTRANPFIGECPSNYVMTVAIDFGTTFSGYAFSFASNKKDIIMFTNWGSCVGLPVSFKAPTCLMTNKHDRFVAFGYEAQHKYSSMTSEEAEEYYFYDKFKMYLHEQVIIVKNHSLPMRKLQKCIVF